MQGTMIQDWEQIEALQDGQCVGAVVWDYERNHDAPVFEGIEAVEIMRWEDGAFLSLTTDHALAHYEESDWAHNRFEGDGHSLYLYLLDESASTPEQPEQPAPEALTVKHTLIQGWAQVEQLQDGQRVGVMVVKYDRGSETVFTGVEPVRIERDEKGHILTVTTEHALAVYAPYEWDMYHFVGRGNGLALYLLDESAPDEPDEPEPEAPAFKDLPWVDALPAELEAVVATDAPPAYWTWRDRLHIEWLLQKAYTAAERALVYADQHGIEIWREAEWQQAEAAAWNVLMTTEMRPNDAGIAHRLHVGGFQQRLEAILTGKVATFHLPPLEGEADDGE